MTEIADTTGTPSAGVSEPSIPKHRFDEVLTMNRALQDQLNTLQTIVANQSRQVQQPAAFTPEALNMDPQLYEAAKKIADQQIRMHVEPLIQKLAHITTDAKVTAEEAAFVSRYGHDLGEEPESTLEKIRGFRNDFAKRHGANIPMEQAFLLVQSLNKAKPARKAAPTPQATEETGNTPQGHTGGQPNPALTRTQPGSSGFSPSPKRFNEMSLEEMEASLQGSFQSGNLL